MKKLLLVFVIGFLFSNELFCQAKTTIQDGQLWLGYFNYTRISKRWGTWLDLHFRTDEKVFNDLSQLLFRGGITYFATEKLRFTAGYVYALQYPGDDAKGVVVPEHRPWQLVQWQTQYPRIRMVQGVRFEQRFRHKVLNNNELAPGYNFNYRLRYNTLFNIPVNKPKIEKNTLAFIISDEVMVNFGKSIVYNYFDQNRFFAGFSWYLNAHDNIQLGYMNLFQQLQSGNRYRSAHILRLYYIQQIDFRKKTMNPTVH